MSLTATSLPASGPVSVRASCVADASSRIAANALRLPFNARMRARACVAAASKVMAVRSLLTPAASQRAVQLHLVLELRHPCLHQHLLVGKKRALRIEQVEVAGHPIVIAQLRQTQADRVGRNRALLRIHLFAEV